MEAYIVDWLNLLVRWLHLITGIAWIGASFYFVMLDNSLTPPKKPEDAKRGVFGELWAVHGGGFYNSQKYLTGPKGEPLLMALRWTSSATPKRAPRARRVSRVASVDASSTTMSWWMGQLCPRMEPIRSARYAALL